MFYESYGIGGWLKWGALLAAGIASPMLCANALMSGRALPTFLELLGPRDQRTRSVLTILLGAALLVTTLIGAETALGFVFDPRYQDFPFAALTMAVLPFWTLMAAQPAAGGHAPDRRGGICRRAGGLGALHRVQRRHGQLAVAVDLRDVSSCSPLRCGGRGACKSQNKQADRETRQADIVEHDAKSGGDQPAGQQHDRRPHASEASR